jgi:ubiquinone/menaquinone biosynthesis C-methylase UbiE
VRHVHGSALSLPFDDATFDAIIMQHVAMQITEKDRLFAELARVVRLGGCLALHELFSGEGEIHYPLPWATEPSMSALEWVEACADRLARLGFAVGPFADESEEGRRFHVANIEQSPRPVVKRPSALRGFQMAARPGERREPKAMRSRLRLSVFCFVSLASGSFLCTRTAAF